MGQGRIKFRYAPATTDSPNLFAISCIEIEVITKKADF